MDGCTSRQMQEAPHGSVFVWGNGDLYYPRALAQHLERTDLEIVAPRWLESSWRRRYLPGLVIDHAAWLKLTNIQHDMIPHARDRVRSTNDGDRHD